MKNQVDAINGISAEEGVGHVLNSLNKTQTKQVLMTSKAAKPSCFYVAPESLVKEEYLNFLKKLKFLFVAIDEVALYFGMGTRFPSRIQKSKLIIDKIAKVPVIALTATATPKSSG